MADLEPVPSKKPKNSAFKQQRLKAWQPILTPKPVIISFLCVGIAFIPIGIALLLASNSVVEFDVRYDQKCSKLGELCTVYIDVDKDMDGPVYFYYRLVNYYQNHRRYVRSRNDDQLRGLQVKSFSDLDNCDPIKSKGDSSNKKNFYYPCGLIAASLFNDSFILYDPSGNIIPWKKEGIAWPSDVDKKFHNPPKDTEGIFVVSDFEDEEFIVWMRTAGLPDFKKLNRIIKDDIKKGNYSITIQNNYPVKDFNGEKHIVLSTTSWAGGKNPFLGITYLVVGGLCVLLAFGFLLKHLIAPRALGDTRYLDWAN